ncbi:MAG: FkbM family methyltransferase [Woeseia sp.]
MAYSRWKRLEKTPGYRRIKLFLKRLAGKELRLKPQLDVSIVKAGGWWFHPDTLNSESIVYSFGIGEDVEFDLFLIKRFGLDVHAFDPTPATIEWLAARQLPASFRFYPWAVAARNGFLRLYPRLKRDGSRSTVMYSTFGDRASAIESIDVPAVNLPAIAKRLGHEQIDLLKMDIEGAEYEVLDNLLQSTVKPRQLLVEFHHRFSGIGPTRTAAMIARLEEYGYRLIAVSETGRELSFMHTCEEQRS